MPTTLSAVPPELLLAVARHLLTIYLPSSLRFRQTSKALCTALMAIKAEAESRRLQWQPELTGAYMSAENHAADKVVVSRMGRTIKLGNLGDFPWVKCGVLPSSGKSSWQIRVDNGGYGQCGNMRIGICDFWGRYFWGLWLDTGRLARCERKLNGERFDVHTAKPDGWPDGDKKKVYGPPDPVPYSDIPPPGANDHLTNKVAK